MHKTQIRNQFQLGFATSNAPFIMFQVFKREYISKL